MNRRHFLKTGLAAAGGLLCPALALPQEKNAAAKKPAASSKRTLQVVELKGRPRERGRIHGEALKERIAELVVIWKDELRKNRFSANPECVRCQVCDLPRLFVCQKPTAGRY